MNEKARNKGRMAIYAMAGFYLVYQAYLMFQGLDNSQGSEKILMVVFMILFAIVGVAMMVMGITTGYKLVKDPGKEEESEISEPEEKAEELEELPEEHDESND